ncbi:coiled-coil domain-containing protein 150-like [Oncorhynchus masou masou]|uniref:coiled-coil domain-containing protein 150-like n=1 Tax=Oncorhynchus masou masou TaxID=90313 RepID=UPI0031838FF8
MMCIVVTKLEGERCALETQLANVKAGTLSSTLQKQEEKNRRLMGKLAAMEHQQQQLEQMLKELMDSKNNLAYEKGKLQLCELESWLGVSHQGGGSVAQTLENILASHSRLQHNTESVQKEVGRREQELASLRRDGLQGQRAIQRLQAEVEKLKEKLNAGTLA